MISISDQLINKLLESLHLRKKLDQVQNGSITLHIQDQKIKKIEERTFDNFDNYKPEITE